MEFWYQCFPALIGYLFILRTFWIAYKKKGVLGRGYVAEVASFQGYWCLVWINCTQAVVIVPHVYEESKLSWWTEPYKSSSTEKKKTVIQDQEGAGNLGLEPPPYETWYCWWGLPMISFTCTQFWMPHFKERLFSLPDTPVHNPHTYSWPAPYVYGVCTVFLAGKSPNIRSYQGSTQGTQIIRVDPEQPVKCFRVSRNCF